MDLVFFGTADFGIPALEALDQEHEIKTVVTQPDRPAGRGLSQRQSPIKRKARELSLSTFQPEDVNSPGAVEKIQSIQPAAYVVAAYGQIISPQLLQIPRWPLNIHGSLLPKYRGAAPVNWAIINGEEETGVTTMVMDEGMDTGPILLQRSVSIENDQTAGKLHDHLAALGAELILETLVGLTEGKLEPRPQEGESSFAPKLSTEDGQVDWEQSSRRVHDQIRGMNPWPGAFTYFDGRKVKLHRSRDQGELAANHRGAEPGEVIGFSDQGVTVLCGQLSAVELLLLQPSSRSSMTGKEFVNGFHLEVGDQFYSE